MPRKRFPDTEAGDAEHFARAFGHCVRFDHRRGRWLVFSKHRWVPDADGELYRIGLEAMRLRQQQALEVKDTEKRKRRFRWAIQGESRRRIENMLAIARTVAPISDNGDDWDSDLWLLGVENGVLNLRTGRLRKGRPSDRITMSTSVPYVPNAASPVWERAVSQIFGEEDLPDYVHRALGYSLTGITKEQCLFMNWGAGANGKSTVLRTVAQVLGDYSDDLPFSALELRQRSSIPNDVAKLVGKRFVTSSETSDEIRLNEARIKALTGGDPVTARFLHREFFTFLPVAKFWLATNHKPLANDNSYGFWRRIRLIPFTQRFAGPSDDRTLGDKLREEAAGILRWLVAGCRAWQTKRLQPPETVKRATEQYEAESDPLTAFLAQRTTTGDGGSVRAGKLYDAYTAWCQEGGDEAVTQKRFGQTMRQRFRVEERSHVVTYFGIALRDQPNGQDGRDQSTHRDPFSSFSSEGEVNGEETCWKGQDGSNGSVTDDTGGPAGRQS